MKTAARGFLPVFSICVLILACGYGQGVLTNRWSMSSQLKEAIARIERVPSRLGEWVGKDWKMDPRMQTMGGVEGYIDRRFTNGRDPTAITVFLVTGRSGPISVHTPDLCYQGIGYVMEAEPVRKELSVGTQSQKVEYFVAKFSKPDAALVSRLKILWTWLGDRGWQAPTNVRAEYMGRPSLYKLYVIQELTRSESESDGAILEQFLQQLFPVLDQALLSLN